MKSLRLRLHGKAVKQINQTRGKRKSANRYTRINLTYLFIAISWLVCGLSYYPLRVSPHPIPLVFLISTHPPVRQTLQPHHRANTNLQTKPNYCMFLTGSNFYKRRLTVLVNVYLEIYRSHSRIE